ncbi:hypothetical protein ACFX11_033728 [Malus domestica]
MVKILSSVNPDANYEKFAKIFSEQQQTFMWEKRKMGFFLDNSYLFCYILDLSKPFLFDSKEKLQGKLEI